MRSAVELARHLSMGSRNATHATALPVDRFLDQIGEIAALAVSQYGNVHFFDTFEGKRIVTRLEHIPNSFVTQGPLSFAHMKSNRVTKRRLDLPTLGVAIAILTAFLLWSLAFTRLPLWIAAPIGSLLLAWYGSLQHETIHGHPTPSKRINALIGGAPLSLWIPYAIYRETHIRHHRHSGRRLTEVGHDPESFYLAPDDVAKASGLRRLLLQANCTLAGRLSIGPLLAITTFWVGSARQLRSSPKHRLIWLRHVIAVASVVAWTRGICHIPLIDYLLLVVYPSAAITNLRSFAEHRANDDSPARTNVVEAGGFWSLLFLNNNLHVAHHAHPHIPWYELPAVWRGMRESSPGAGLIFTRGYLEVCRQYLFRRFITPEHPFIQARRQ